MMPLCFISGSVSWGELSAVCGVLSFLGVVATAYLKLFISGALTNMRDKLTADMKDNFVLTVAHRPEMHNIKKEIVRNEAEITKAHERIDAVDLRVTKVESEIKPKQK